jgi:hypothetical protein
MITSRSACIWRDILQIQLANRTVSHPRYLRSDLCPKVSVDCLPDCQNGAGSGLELVCFAHMSAASVIFLSTTMSYFSDCLPLLQAPDDTLPVAVP